MVSNTNNIEAKKAIVVAGVSGCGKTTVAAELARHLQWTFLEGDDYHSEESKAKMASGQALNDKDRMPWLERLNKEMVNRSPAVLACSALKKIYRDSLSNNLAIKFVWLSLSPEVAFERVASRSDHFMPAELVNSQFRDAETPADAIILDATACIDDLIADAVDALALFTN